MLLSILLKNRCQILRTVSNGLKVVNRPLQCNNVHYKSYSLLWYHQNLQNNLLSKESTSCLTSSRWKSKKGKHRENEDFSDDEFDFKVAEEDDDGTLGKDSKLVNVSVTSLRIDLLVKAALSIARNKVEALFYESKILVNGEKLMKKSNQFYVGDEIDVVRGPSSSNPERFVEVTRLKVLAATQKNEERIIVRLRRFPKLIVDNENK